MNQSTLSDAQRREAERVLAARFPAVDPHLIPCGNRILVQVASPLEKTAGGILKTSDTMETEMWNETLCKVLVLGPVAYCNRDTMEKWPEGNWCKPGDFIHASKYAGDRKKLPTPDGKGVALFATIADRDVYSVIEDGYDPLTMKAWF